MLERGAGRPLREQLEVALRDAVRAGRLSPGTRLPSSRVFAEELGVSRSSAAAPTTATCAASGRSTGSGATSSPRPPLPSASPSKASPPAACRAAPPARRRGEGRDGGEGSRRRGLRHGPLPQRADPPSRPRPGLRRRGSRGHPARHGGDRRRRRPPLGGQPPGR
ncbi:MAG: GntR family transcriptional regulator [Euzebyaceae bacterium]|nr:GntR family transcriptional regulator [Euzebyaceae bacterium]